MYWTTELLKQNQGVNLNANNCNVFSYIHPQSYHGFLFINTNLVTSLYLDLSLSNTFNIFRIQCLQHIKVLNLWQGIPESENIDPFCQHCCMFDEFSDAQIFHHLLRLPVFLPTAVFFTAGSPYAYNLLINWTKIKINARPHSLVANK